MATARPGALPPSIIKSTLNGEIVFPGHSSPSRLREPSLGTSGADAGDPARVVAAVRGRDPHAAALGLGFGAPGRVPFELRNTPVAEVAAARWAGRERRTASRRGLATPGRSAVLLPVGRPTERLGAVREIAARVGVSASDVLALGGRVVHMLTGDACYSADLLSDDYGGAPVVQHPRSGALYAVARGYAVELNTLGPAPDDAEAIARGFRSVPLLIGGKAVIREGLDVLCLCSLRPRHVGLSAEHLAWHPRGWVYERELTWPEATVTEAVIGDLAAGRWTLGFAAGEE